MIRPQLTPDGGAIRLADDRPAVILDDLAAAYADDPQTLGRLLAHHGRAVAHLDHAATDQSATDYGRAMAAAEADASRDALCGELTPPAALDHVIGCRQARRLADDLTAYAAHAARVHLAQNRKTA